MQIEVKIEPGCSEPRVVIYTDRMTESIQQLLIGFSGEEATVLSPDALLRIYTESGRVIAVSEQGIFTLRGALYEWEQRLDPKTFVRISQSEIIHLKKVKGFDLSLAGTICVRMTDGTMTYASRRYVARMKKLLGL